MREGKKMKKSIQNFLYGVKLFLIVSLAFLLLASIEIAPYHPLLFTAAVLIDSVCIRFLWKSLQQDEKKPSGTRPTCVSLPEPDPKHAA